MKLKSYFSATVEAAMDMARKELGVDALLIHARPATPETRYLGAYEVVFGMGAPEPQPASAAAQPPSPGLAREVEELKRQVERLTAALLRPQPEAAAAIGDAAERTPAMTCATDATLGRPGAARRVVALVGPPGAGKTTTLIKLAARYGLACPRPTQILTADVHRIAAADQLRTLAAILGIGCEVAETPVSLSQALEEYRSRAMILIDTPGLSFREMEDGADLARLLRSHPEVDTHLVLPASMKPAYVSRFLDHYGMFEPNKLIFTRLDETADIAALVGEAATRGLPVSFLATGQQIPDDLEEATPQRIAELASEPFRSPPEKASFGAAA